MKDFKVKQLFVFLFIIIQITAYAQTEKKYFQQKVDYKVDVVLNDLTKSLDGYMEINYHNNSPDTLDFIWFHLWPNAFKNDQTAFSEQLLQNGRTDFYFSSDDKRGFINRLEFKVNNLPAVLYDHPQFIDVAKLMLPFSLLPGETIKISTPFHVKIPFNFSRGGYTDHSFQITQWYPKPAVYDRKGWHPMPYLDQGEFFSEFGDFDVKITVPEKYVIAATGEMDSVVNVFQPLTEQREKVTNSGHINSGSKQKSFINREKIQKDGEEISRINKPLNGLDSNRGPKDFSKDSSSGKWKSYYFKQDDVHDFAWFADKNLIVKNDTLRLPSGRIIDVYAYFSPSGREVWKNSISFLKDAITSRSEWLGEYPYSTIKAIETKMAFAGGMEYPTITNISPVEDEKTLDLIIEHEVGHNWNYGILATNERDYPWMDEGINTYYDNRYETLKYPLKSIGQKRNFLSKKFPVDFMDLGYRILTANKNDQPIETASGDFSDMNYALIAYYKSGLWMETLENYLGKSVLDRAMQEYFNRWKFKHPYPSDFKKIVEDVSGKNVDSVFSLLYKKGIITPIQKKQLKVSAFFSFIKTDKYHYIFLSPAVGTNHYDKIMLGGIVHNYTLPEPNFHFLIAPMFATGSKSFVGIARVGYNIMSYGPIRKTEISLSASKFTINSFVDLTGRANYMGYHKLVPGIKLIFKNKDANSKVTKFLQWKTYFIEETDLLFSRDTIEQKEIITYPKTNRYLNQLTLSLENNRVLYPYSGKVMAEQGSGFARITFDGNYYFFVNSVKFMQKMIKNCNLNDVNCRVIYSDSNVTELPIQRGRATDPAKKINFITSCAFEGSDFYDEDGKTVIVSDGNRANTLIDISTQLLQIAGRIRDSKYRGHIWHVLSNTRYSGKLSYGEFRSNMYADIENERLDVEQFNKMDEDAKIKYASLANFRFFQVNEKTKTIVQDLNASIHKASLLSFHSYSFLIPCR